MNGKSRRDAKKLPGRVQKEAQVAETLLTGETRHHRHQNSSLRSNIKGISDLEAWIQPDVFERLSYHHPMISPATTENLSSSFLSEILQHLHQAGTKLRVHIGTAEAFYDSSCSFVGQAESAGMDVELSKDIGGYHIEGCVFPAELGGSAAQLRRTLITWVSELDDSTVAN